MLSIKAHQNPTDPNGWCQLRIDGLTLSAPEALEVSFKRAGSTKPFLAECGWQQNATWLLFEDVHALNGAAMVRIGPQQTKFLSQVTTVEVAVRRVGQQADRAHPARVAWPRIILETEDRSGMPPVTGGEPPPASPADAPVSVPAPELYAITAEDRPVRSADRPRATRIRWPLITGITLVSVSFAALAVLYFLKLPPFEAAALDPVVPRTRPVHSRRRRYGGSWPQIRLRLHLSRRPKRMLGPDTPI
jgi:hypothetical protein